MEKKKPRGHWLKISSFHGIFKLPQNIASMCQVLVDDEKPDIIGITETWVKEDFGDEFFNS